MQARQGAAHLFSAVPTGESIARSLSRPIDFDSSAASLVISAGGYNGFDFDISAGVKPAGNELLVRHCLSLTFRYLRLTFRCLSLTYQVYVFDPSDSGKQPNGKQRISAIDNPGNRHCLSLAFSLPFIGLFTSFHWPFILAFH